MDSSGSDNSGKKRTRSQTTLDQFSFVNLANSPLKQAKSALKLNVHSLPHIPSTAASSKDSPFVTNHADTTLLEHPPRRNKADPHNPVADRQRKRPPSRGSPSVGADSTLSPNAPSLPHPQIAALSYKDPLLVTRNEDASSKETRSEREQVNGHSPVVEGRAPSEVSPLVLNDAHTSPEELAFGQDNTGGHAHGPEGPHQRDLPLVPINASACSTEPDLRSDKADGHEQRKRPSSPGKDDTLSHEHTAKRRKHNTPSIFPRTPAYAQQSNNEQRPSSAYRRALSVPAVSSSVPLLDLNVIPPSPRRSPTKFRIASVPPERPPEVQPLDPPRLQLSSIPPSPSPLPSLPRQSPSRSPLSPLSPLPQTEDDTMTIDPVPLPVPVSATTTTLADPKPPPTSDTLPTRLPVPSVVSRMKPKQTAPPKKPRAPRSVKQTGPATIRMTRSVSLRQKKVEEEAKQRANPQPGPSATPHRRRSQSFSSYAQPTAASAAKASPVKPASSRPSSGAPFQFTFTPSAAATPRFSHARPSAGPSLVPTPSANARAGPSSVQSQQGVRIQAAGTNGTQPLQLTSSLSTLNQALERLNAPPPSRPNTSMGFHPDPSAASDGEDNGDRAGEQARPGSALDAPMSVAKGKAKPRLVLTASKPLSTAAKVGPGVNAGRAQAQGAEKKVLRQTMLMLPPPLPAPDKARAANSTPDDRGTPKDGEGDADEEKKRKVNLALAPSLGKIRNSLGFGLPPASSGSGSTSTAAGPSNAPPAVKTAQAAPSQKRIFPVTSSSNGRAVFGGHGGSGTARPSSSGASSSGSGLRTGITGLRGIGRGAGPWRGIGGRAAPRVSKKSSLPVVQGSPVKGGAAVGTTEEPLEDLAMNLANAAAEEDEEGEGERTTKDRIGEWLKNASADVLRDLGHIDGSEDAIDTRPDSLHSTSEVQASPAGPSSSPNGDGACGSGSKDHGQDSAQQSALEKAREREKEWRRNASRRASLASQLLSQSLSAVPDTPSPMADVKGKGKMRAASSSWPAPRSEAGGAEDRSLGEVDSGSGSKEAGEMPPPPVPPPRTRSHNTRLATGALSTPPNANSSRSSAGDKGKGKERAKEGESPAALAVLRGCTIFVDVRTEEGDDAGALFVDMLRGLGAKIATRVGSRCTHVVYKNGLMSTLTRYRLLKDPKPFTVGIAWVVECAEQRTRVDETRFLVNLDMANVAGVNKRRRSMLPKFLSSPGSDAKVGGVASPASSDSSVRTTATNVHAGMNGVARLGRGHPGERSMETSSPTATATAMDEDGDSSMQSNGAAPPGADEEDSLPPLEKARRRRSMLPAR